MPGNTTEPFVFTDRVSFCYGFIDQFVIYPRTTEEQGDFLHLFDFLAWIQKLHVHVPLRNTAWQTPCNPNTKCEENRQRPSLCNFTKSHQEIDSSYYLLLQKTSEGSMPISLIELSPTAVMAKRRMCSLSIPEMHFHKLFISDDLVWSYFAKKSILEVHFHKLFISDNLVWSVLQSKHGWSQRGKAQTPNNDTQEESLSCWLHKSSEWRELQHKCYGSKMTVQLRKMAVVSSWGHTKKGVWRSCAATLWLIPLIVLNIHISLLRQLKNISYDNHLEKEEYFCKGDHFLTQENFQLNPPETYAYGRWTTKSDSQRVVCSHCSVSFHIIPFETKSVCTCALLQFQPRIDWQTANCIHWTLPGTFALSFSAIWFLSLAATARRARSKAEQFSALYHTAAWHAKRSHNVGWDGVLGGGTLKIAALQCFEDSVAITTQGLDGQGGHLPDEATRCPETSGGGAIAMQPTPGVTGWESCSHQQTFHIFLVAT